MSDWTQKQKSEAQTKFKDAHRLGLAGQCLGWVKELARYKLLLRPEHGGTIEKVEEAIADLYREVGGVGPGGGGDADE